MIADKAIREDKNSTAESIREVIGSYRDKFAISDAEAETIAREMETRHAVTMSFGIVLQDETHKPWYDNARVRIDPYFWNRYEELLRDKGFSGSVVAALDRDASTILDHMEDPKRPGPWDSRGMVVGHVQSGKTANYIGLINKAADAGYKLIVVVAGIHNNLRNQTQHRVDEGFVGKSRNSTPQRDNGTLIGVGKIDKQRQPATFTTTTSDFNKTIATGMGIPLQNMSEPAVFVIKKNARTLKNLVDWLRENGLRGSQRAISEPFLLIDDEADNASINTAYSRDEVTRINQQLRELLTLFERSAYVGYTATPFANIFIDPDTDDEMLGADLFPRDFIFSLDPPSNYVGAERVFLADDGVDSPLRIVREISDNEDLLPLKHNINLQISTLPESLRAAIRTYVIARAIRIKRGQPKKHSSMLVNASRFTRVQSIMANRIHEYLKRIQDAARIYGGLPEQAALRDPMMRSIHASWEAEYANTEIEWAEVQPALFESASPISVVEINSGSKGTLDYDGYPDGRHVIAVGGYSLSRGLTLEGLTVSYFLRNSMMYDTLMQMGRWFGYRSGYEDVCRVWMTREAEGWYRYVTEAIEELRGDLRLMQQVNATPREFGLRVRSHPASLVVTARNKMGSGQRHVRSIQLAKSFVETTVVRGDNDSRIANLELVEYLAGQVQAIGSGFDPLDNPQPKWTFRNVQVGLVLDFINRFRAHPKSALTNPLPLGEYIEGGREDELATWVVHFVTLKSQANGPHPLAGLEINLQQRTLGKQATSSAHVIGDNQRVASRGIELIGLTGSQKSTAEEQYLQERIYNNKSTEQLNVPDRLYRAQRTHPLLAIHLLKVDPSLGEEAKFKDPILAPVVAFSISFPETTREAKRVEYIVNSTWMHDNYGADDIDEDESDDSEL